MIVSFTEIGDGNGEGDFRVSGHDPVVGIDSFFF